MLGGVETPCLGFTSRAAATAFCPLGERGPRAASLVEGHVVHSPTYFFSAFLPHLTMCF